MALVLAIGIAVTVVAVMASAIAVAAEVVVAVTVAVAAAVVTAWKKKNGFLSASNDAVFLSYFFLSLYQRTTNFILSPMNCNKMLIKFFFFCSF